MCRLVHGFEDGKVEAGAVGPDFQVFPFKRIAERIEYILDWKGIRLQQRVLSLLGLIGYS